MKKWPNALVAATIAFASTALFLLPVGARADVSHADAIALVDGNSFGVRLKWTYETSEGLEIRLYHNNTLVKTATPGMWGDPGRNDSASMDTSPVRPGTYKVTLWSNTFSKEVYSRSWDVPRLNITVAVDPGSGHMGTTFVATSTFFINSTALDMIRFSGTLQVDAGPAVLRQAVGGTLYSDHYYTYNEKTGYTIEPVFFTTGFTFPAGGDYVISARYNDSTTNISAVSGTVVMEDQYVSLMAAMQDELNESRAGLDSVSAGLQGALDLLSAVNDTLNGTRAALCETERDLGSARAGLDAAVAAQKGAEDRLSALNGTLNGTAGALGEARRDLNSTRAELEARSTELKDAENRLAAVSGDLNRTKKDIGDTTDDLEGRIAASNQLALMGMVAGVLGIVLGAAAIVLSRRKKDAPPAWTPPPAQQAPQPPQDMGPSPAAPPPRMQPPAPEPLSREAPGMPPAPSGPSPCSKCGMLVAAGMRFCGNCGAPR